jgi:hypothetical protein
LKVTVRIVDPHTIVVFTIPPVDLASLTEMLELAACRVRHDAAVVPARFVADIGAAGDGSRYLYCTVGLLRFPKTPGRAGLERARLIVADLVVECELGVLA